MLCCLLVLLHAYLDPRTAEEADARDDGEDHVGDGPAFGRVRLRWHVSVRAAAHGCCGWKCELVFFSQFRFGMPNNAVSTFKFLLPQLELAVIARAASPIT